MTTKYIFVTGGVVSSLGKGITAASLGRLLKSRGLKVGIQKFDPYINMDPGTLSPYQHGEVFVTNDGSETDLDLGHYERFIDIELTKYSSVSMGRVYGAVLDNERWGKYEGGTVQVIPHITNEAKERMLYAGREYQLDVVITEIGGTVGDIESLPYLETIRQIRQDLGKENTLFIHMTLVPYIKSAGEAKTKPTQHSVKELRSIGIQPDIIACRAEMPLSKELTDKIALFCDTDQEAVIQVVDAENIFEVPLLLAEQGLDQLVVDRLGLSQAGPLDIDDWRAFYHRVLGADKEVEVALVGKYVELQDAYLSVAEALRHAGYAHDAKVKIRWVNATELTPENCESELSGVSGIIVPSGFGVRGGEGKILAAGYARTHQVPFLGIGMGMQAAIVEFARNVVGIKDANLPEVTPKPTDPIIEPWMPEALNQELGGTLCLGLGPCHIEKEGKALAAYGESEIAERHRHRYQFNNDYKKTLAEHGMIFSAINPESEAVEIIELADHPWFVACLFHPEFKSRPQRPHPLFRDFIGQALARA